jgi:predicted ATPase
MREELHHLVDLLNVELGDLLLLVGPNGSGKSNFLDALRLTSEPLQMSLEQALRTRGGVAEVRRRSTGHPAHFAIDLDFRSADFTGDYGFEVGAVRGGGFRVSYEYCRLWLASRGEYGGRDADARFYVKDGQHELLRTDQLLPVIPEPAETQ